MKQFFVDGTGALSMGRLLIFATHLVTSLVIIKLAFSDKMTEGYVGVYLTAFVTNVIGSKVCDAFGKQP